jgi:nicotinamidase-related amidase
MRLDLATLVHPDHTALVTQECQEGVIGETSALPDLAAGVARVGMVGNVARLLDAARSAGVKIVHCTFARRRDAFGANRNARIFTYMARVEHPLWEGSEAARLAAGIGALPEEPVIERWHGLSPFQGTELDWVLRNEGVTTIVGTGVSVNVAIPSLCFDAVNSGYQMVVPRDAVAGFPAEYVEQVFEHSLAALATLTTTDDLIAAWTQTGSAK